MSRVICALYSLLELLARHVVRLSGGSESVKSEIREQLDQVEEAIRDYEE